LHHAAPPRRRSRALLPVAHRDNLKTITSDELAAAVKVRPSSQTLGERGLSVCCAGMGGRARVGVLLASVVVALVSVEAASGSDGLPQLLTRDLTARFSVKPPEIILIAPGPPKRIDEVIGGEHAASLSFGSIAWTSWSTTKATATATVWADQIAGKPADTFYAVGNAEITALDVQDGRFTRLKITYPGKPGYAESVLTRGGGPGRYRWG
jgi:hypothetical protein